MLSQTSHCSYILVWKNIIRRNDGNQTEPKTTRSAYHFIIFDTAIHLIQLSWSHLVHMCLMMFFVMVLSHYRHLRLFIPGKSLYLSSVNCMSLQVNGMECNILGQYIKQWKFNFKKYAFHEYLILFYFIIFLLLYYNLLLYIMNSMLLTPCTLEKGPLHSLFIYISNNEINTKTICCSFNVLVLHIVWQEATS